MLLRHAHGWNLARSNLVFWAVVGITCGASALTPQLVQAADISACGVIDSHAALESERIQAEWSGSVAAGLVPIDETLWCVSSDDPRCSPIHTNESGGSSLSAAYVGKAGAATMLDVPPPSSTAYVWPMEFVTLSSTTPRLLDRPPRS